MTITAEQARALQAGITPGPWNVTTPVPDAPEFRVIHHGDDGLSDCGKYMSVNGQVSLDDASAIAAVPDMLATIIALSARIEALEAEKAELRTLLARNLVMDFGSAEEGVDALGGFKEAFALVHAHIAKIEKDEADD